MSDGVKKINEYLIKDGRTLVLTNFISDTSNLAEGTIFINPNSGDLEYIKLNNNNSKTWTRFSMNNLFDKDSFDSSLVKDNSLHAAKLIDLSISNSKIADSSITTSKIADKAITNSKFNLNSIDADKILDSSITTAKIHDQSITSSKIASKAINTNHIADKTITLDKMAINSIGVNNIIDKAIISNKIADGAIIKGLIGDGAICSTNIAEKEVKTINLDNLSVTTEKIADGAVQGKKIPNAGIKDIHIDTMDGYKILDNTISTSKLKNSSIVTNLIADKAVTFNKLDSDTQSMLNNSIKIQAAVTIGNIEHYNTGLIKGSLVLKTVDETNANIEVYGNITATGDITGARVFNPYFADIAEAYYPTGPLFPGDPVALCECGGLRVEKLNEDNTSRFLGFVSNEYATLLGGDKSDVSSGRMVPICLIGRIKAKLPDYLIGDLGDYINLYKYDGLFFVSKRKTDWTIGRLLETKTSRSGKVLCQLWP